MPKNANLSMQQVALNKVKVISSNINNPVEWIDPNTHMKTTGDAPQYAICVKVNQAQRDQLMKAAGEVQRLENFTATNNFFRLTQAKNKDGSVEEGYYLASFNMIKNREKFEFEDWTNDRKAMDPGEELVGCTISVGLYVRRSTDKYQKPGPYITSTVKKVIVHEHRPVIDSFPDLGKDDSDNFGNDDFSNLGQAPAAPAPGSVAASAPTAPEPQPAYSGVNSDGSLGGDGDVPFEI